ncbi:alpha-L-fucosidase [Gryllotalpicola protaetiae]|uniref:alpha-L-fucosidase n=1 Tax=Gryllotalpicola protaetiae TaxID=2419771 RepID=A0A387BSG1_9MICO|nr:alpha-L-fucosidase [Gryllotalpicola protaetiae]AYG03956.1 alpha-L-fucosidase [Gryllotalpicola protaetiae]
MRIPRPTSGQLAWQRLRLGVFFHFGLNTFHDLEWSDGSLSAASFDPGDLDAEQWVRTAAELGARYVVLTAKHHDGFCLWPTATTDYSVASAPWRGGAGDVVREVADACARHGVRFGFYLSPWDRHAPEYADPAAYDELYTAQLRELCANYGDVAEVWFDGAGSESRVYDWERYLAVAAELQPHAMVFNMGAPTIRWVGNEDGLAHDPVRYAVDRGDLSNYSDETVGYGHPVYLPPECDVSLRHGWFWAARDEPKSLEHLLAIYYGSIGMGANLLLNLPPDSRGLLPDADVARVRELRAELDRRFGDPLAAVIGATGDGVRLDFGREVLVDHLVLKEGLVDGQRVTGFEIVTDAGEPLASGGSVGAQRICVFPARRVRSLSVRLRGDGAVLTSATGYRTGASVVPTIGYTAPTEAPE